MSPRILSQRTLDLLGDMPPYLRDDPMVQAVISAEGNEFQRIENAGAAVAGALIPSQASDVVIPNGVGTARVLSMWETLLGLPVSPAGVTMADRRAKVQAHIQKRNSGSGLDWQAVLTQALGTSAWTYSEGPGNYQVTLHIAYSSGSYSAGQVAALARLITPAHLDVLVGYNNGFLIGISIIGTEPL